MVGKASILLVMGFSLIFLVFGQKFVSLSNDAVDNMTNYYAETVSHDCSVAGANMAANKVFLDPTWNAGFSNLSFNGGIINTTVSTINAFQNIIQIKSVGTYQGITHTTTVVLQPSKFSKFAYYSTSEGSNIWWTATDTVWGPFHTQDDFRAYGHPVFIGKATSKGSLDYYTSKNADAPVFDGGYESGVDLPLPTDGLTPIKNDAIADGWDIKQSYTSDTVQNGNGLGGILGGRHSGHHSSGGTPTYTVTQTLDTAYITFAKDSVKIKLGYDLPESEYLTSDVAPNGVIYVEGMDVRLQGMVKGQYTVASDGDIYLDGDIVYNTDPLKDPNSTDLLGIVAQNNVWITDNKANNNGINIDAAIYTQTGGFGAQDYNTRPNSGSINLLGGITQNVRQAVGTFSAFGISTGFSKRYRYDNRLMLSSPPSFPGTGSFEVVSWLEE
jgi:hypothetical protein